MQAIFAIWMATSSTHFVWLNNVVWERGKGSKFMEVADLPYDSPVRVALYT